MPTSLRLALLPQQRGKIEHPAPLHMHALISTLLAESDEEHQVHDKPWSIAPAVVQSNAMYLLLSWLPDGAPPELAALEDAGVRLGSRLYEVASLEAQSVPLGLLGVESSSSVELSFVTPTWFTRGGGEYALPDPYLVFRRLADRWNTVCEDRDLLDLEEAEELLRQIRITRFDGRSAPFETGRGRKTGFVGWARYQLPRAAPKEAATMLAKLSRFAAFSGVGAMTTYGAGHVEVLVSD